MLALMLWTGVPGYAQGGNDQEQHAPDMFISNNTYSYETGCFGQQIRITALFNTHYSNVNWSVSNSAATITVDPFYHSHAVLTWNHYPTGPVTVTVSGDNGYVSSPGDGGYNEPVPDPGLEGQFFHGTVTISFQAGPQVAGDSRCQNETKVLSLRASGGSEGNYRWYRSDMSPIAGATGSLYEVSVAQTTTFYVSTMVGECESARVPVMAGVNSSVVFTENFDDLTASNYTQRFSTDYTYQSSNLSTGKFFIGGNASTTNSWRGLPRTGSGKFLIADGLVNSNFTLRSEWYPSCTDCKFPWKKKIKVVAGMTYRVSAYFKNIYPENAEAGFFTEVPVLAINNRIVARTETRLLYNSDPYAWTLVSNEWTAPLGGADANGEIEIELAAGMLSIKDTKGYDYAVDDIKLEAVASVPPSVNIAQNANENLSGQTKDICAGSPVTLYAAGSPTNLYQWYESVGGGWKALDGPQGNSLQVQGFSLGEKAYAVESYGGHCANSKKATITLKIQELELTALAAVNGEGKTATDFESGGVYYLARVGERVYLRGNASEEISSFTCEWGDGNVSTASTLESLSHVYQGAASNYTVRVTASSALGCQTTALIMVKTYSIIWEMDVPLAAMTAQRDKLTGAYFLTANCEDRLYVLSCFSAAGEQPLADVVNSSFVSYSRLDVLQDGSAISNPYQQGMYSFKPQAAFQYNTDQVTGGDNYASGKFTVSSPFNWYQKALNHHPNWLPQNEVTKVSGNGEIVEEKNLLDIKSAAKFGYSGALPYLVAQNAELGAVVFESFETVARSVGGNTVFEDNFSIPTALAERTEATAHAGSGSLAVKSTGGTVSLPVKSVEASPGIISSGMLLQVWVKVKAGGAAYAASLGSLPTTLLKLKLLDATYNSISFHNLTEGSSDAVASANLIPIAQTGEWMLYQAHVRPLGAHSSSNVPVFLTPVLEYEGSVGQLWLDDLRVQPGNAQVTTYVYDYKTLNLVTSFDDQHFGLYYQYNEEGKLIRKQIETVRGLKTVQETQYNTPKETL